LPKRVEAQRKAKEAAGQLTREQTEKAAEFWKKMVEEGIVEE
jgi:hypothetical protein